MFLSRFSIIDFVVFDVECHRCFTSQVLPNIVFNRDVYTTVNAKSNAPANIHTCTCKHTTVQACIFLAHDMAAREEPRKSLINITKKSHVVIKRKTADIVATKRETADIVSTKRKTAFKMNKADDRSNIGSSGRQLAESNMQSG